MLTLPLALLTLAVGTHPSSEGKPCHHAEKEGASCAPAAAGEQPKDKDGLVLRGEKVSGKATVTLAQLLKSPSEHQGKTVLVEGDVRKACERKGCWMELASSAKDKGPGVRVTFKDYGFFVPLSSAGSRARVKGEVQLAELSEERAKHYESEGATVPRAADGKPREVQLIATGVELRK